MNETFLTTDEVLEYLQVNLRTVYRLIKAGKIPAVRVGRQWRFRKADIDAWLDSQRPRGGPRPAPATEFGQRRGNERPRILVADDEASIRDLLSKTLTMDGHYDVDTVSDGRSAIEKFRLHAYDLLIIDLKMPGMDGLSVIREIRQLAPAVPTIVVTGYSTEPSAVEAANLRVSGYLKKPFRIKEVLDKAAEAIGP